MAKYRDLDWEIDRELGRISEDEALGISAPWHRRLRQALAKSRIPRLLWFPFRLAWRVATVPVITNMPIVQRIVNWPREVKAPWYYRLADALLTRLVLAPVLAFIFFGFLVWRTTHPSLAYAVQTPGQYDTYYKEVSIGTQDRQRIDLWYIPAVTVDEMVRNPDEALRERRPGVVLVHALGQTNEQYLPLALRLSQQGYAVALVNTRGQCPDGAAVTFGLREGLDVLAAVNYLREHPNVDPDRIAVIGSGVGGAAVLHAAALDHSIAAVCADDVWPNLESFVAHGLQARYVPTRLATSLYVMVFETLLRERSADGDLEQVMSRISQPALLIARATPGSAPAADVFRLSAQTSGPHKAILVDPLANPQAASSENVEKQIQNFLNATMHWEAPQTRTNSKIQRLLDAQVQ